MIYKNLIKKISIMILRGLYSCEDIHIELPEVDISTTVTATYTYNYTIPIGEFAIIDIAETKDTVSYDWISENYDIASCQNDTIFGNKVGKTRVLNANATESKYIINVNVVNH